MRRNKQFHLWLMYSIAPNLHKKNWKFRESKCFAQEERTCEDKDCSCLANSRVTWDPALHFVASENTLSCTFPS